MILAILQARMSSSRLPGKVLKDIVGKPMILRQVERIRRATSLDRLLIATSDDPSDDPLYATCLDNGLSCFRGSLDDVLDRFYQAAKEFHPDYIVRLTGDCPLTDPDVIDKVVAFGITGSYDYASNTLKPTFPDGLDVEMTRFECLETAWREALLPAQREHVTSFIYQNPERFRLGSFVSTSDLSGLRWTVDHARDLNLVERIYGALYPAKPEFSTSDILQLLEQKPELRNLNTDYRRNEKLAGPAVTVAQTNTRGR